MSSHLFLLPGAVLALYSLVRIVNRKPITAPGQALQAKFVGMGTLKGKTKAEIVGVVGSA